jgi:hypothetical protein
MIRCRVRLHRHISVPNPLHNKLLDTSTYESLFLACVQGDASLFKTTFQALLNQEGPNILQPAACLAAQKQKHHILGYCLEQGAVFDRYLERAAQMGATGSLEMLEVLLEADWAGIRSNREAVERQVSHYGQESFEGKWLMKNAGKGGDGLDGKTARLRKGTNEELKGGREKVKQTGGKGSSKKGEKDESKGKNALESGKADPKQGPTSEQIQKWFGDVPW